MQYYLGNKMYKNYNIMNKCKQFIVRIRASLFFHMSDIVNYAYLISTLVLARICYCSWIYLLQYRYFFPFLIANKLVIKLRATKEQKKIISVIKNIVIILKILINNKNKRHVIKEAIVPGACFIFPIIKKVRKNKLNFLIIFNNRSYDFRSYGFFFSY